jgi:hypothetical protein
MLGLVITCELKAVFRIRFPVLSAASGPLTSYWSLMPHDNPYLLWQTRLRYLHIYLIDVWYYSFGVLIISAELPR